MVQLIDYSKIKETFYLQDFQRLGVSLNEIKTKFQVYGARPKAVCISGQMFGNGNDAIRHSSVTKQITSITLGEGSYSESQIQLGDKATLDNSTEHDMPLSNTVNRTVTNTVSSSISGSVTVSFEATEEVDIGFAKGSTKEGVEIKLTGSGTWTKSSQVSVEDSTTMQVPAKKHGELFLLGTKGKYEIPFTMKISIAGVVNCDMGNNKTGHYFYFLGVGFLLGDSDNRFDPSPIEKEIKGTITIDGFTGTHWTATISPLS